MSMSLHYESSDPLLVRPDHRSMYREGGERIWDSNQLLAKFRVLPEYVDDSKDNPCYNK